jgi:hypothetical protein
MRIGFIFIILFIYKIAICQSVDSLKKDKLTDTHLKPWIYKEYTIFFKTKNDDTILQKYYKRSGEVLVFNKYVKFKNGWALYFSNGILKEFGDFENKYKFYQFLNRNYYLSRKFHVQIKKGKWEYYNDDGNLIKQEFYENGKVLQ